MMRVSPVAACCAVATVLALSACAARGQIAEVYGTFSPTHVSGVETGTISSPGGSQTQTATFTSPAFGGGVTLNFLNLHVVKLGVDLRGSTRPGTTGVDTALFGLKLAVQPPLLRLKPYVQASGGYMATRTANLSTTTTGAVGGTFTNQYAVFEVLGGVDYPLVPFVDLRLVEVGGGTGISTGQYNPSFYIINTGVVLHF